MKLPERVHIVDVGPRDGFQTEQAFIPTALKIRIIDQIARSGIKKIETTAFVSPEAVPQMADARDVLEGIERVSGVSYTVLVPNRRGAELALNASVDGIRVVVCASETFNQRNVRMSVDASVAETAGVVELAGPAGIPVEVAIGVSFGCPFEGPTPEKRVSDLARRFADLGVREISIADTVGMANPLQVSALMARLIKEVGSDCALSLHIHNTRGLGFANVLAGLAEGIDTFDASIGGLGGCPVTPAATGNIPTEDLVNMCAEMGLGTGVDIDGIMTASRLMEEFLGRRLPSHVLLSGTNRQAVDRHRSA